MKAKSRLTSSFCLVALAGLLLACGGCKHTDLLEAELRTRENDVRDLKEALYRAECENRALMREIHAVRQDGSGKISPERASQSFRLQQIVLGRGTGGLDNDDR